MHPPQLDDPFAADRLNRAGDYHPDWDIPAQGKAFTDAFAAAIEDVRLRPPPDPKRKVQAFIGQAGYGKTHLFGRLRHLYGSRVFFAYIAAPPGLEGGEKKRQLETSLRWQLVEALLSSIDSVAPFRVELARLLVPSFQAYFERLDAGLRATCGDELNGLETDDAHLTVLEFFGHVEALEPYHQLADAVQARLTGCPGPVVRASS